MILQQYVSAQRNLHTWQIIKMFKTNTIYQTI